MNYRTVGQELDREVLKFQRHHPGVSYSQALEVVMADNPDLAKEYVQEFSHLSQRHVKQFGIEPDYEDEDVGSVAAGKQIDEIVMSWLRNHPQAQYSEGLAIALRDHPDLRMLWLKKYEGADTRSGKPWQSPSGGYATFDDNKSADKIAVYRMATEAFDALVAKIQKESPNLTLEQCIAEARARTKKKGEKKAEKIDALSLEMQELRDCLTALRSA